MNFDLDDPLESDDSFFDEPKAFGKKGIITKPTEKKGKKSVENLFDVDEKDDNKTPHESLTILADTNLKPKHTVTFDNTVKQLENIGGVTKPKDDWLGDSKNSKVFETHSTKKMDFFDDILSTRQKSAVPTKKLSSLDDILKDSNATKTSTFEKDLPLPTQTVSNLEFSAASRDRRRPRKGSSTGIADALGLFGDDSNKKEDVTKSAEDITSNVKFENGKYFELLSLRIT